MVNSEKSSSLSKKLEQLIVKLVFSGNCGSKRTLKMKSQWSNLAICAFLKKVFQQEYGMDNSEQGSCNFFIILNSQNPNSTWKLNLSEKVISCLEAKYSIGGIHFLSVIFSVFFTRAWYGKFRKMLFWLYKALNLEIKRRKRHWFE